jgi:L-malate glycosyltransferase
MYRPEDMWLPAFRKVMDNSKSAPRVCLVGPLPPPAGGMAGQCELLLRLLRAEGLTVDFVCTNAPYHPAWVRHVPVLRAGFRLLPYVSSLWAAVGRAQLVHLLANSGWAWHLFAAPALWVGRLRGTPVIVNYRGGNAEQFFAAAPAFALKTLRAAALRVTPSEFLRRVFGRLGVDAEVIPNVVDLSRFAPHSMRDFGVSPHLIVTRNLEPIYDIGTALRAFAIVRKHYADARLTVAGSGPELERLMALASELGVGDAVSFAGRIAHAEMPKLYAGADCALNPSAVDNMPNSVLEAFACGVPVVSTDAGGVPDLVMDGVNGLLVPVGDAQAMASKVVCVLGDRALAQRLVAAGSAEAQRYAWSTVRRQWLEAYRRVAGSEDRV